LIKHKHWPSTRRPQPKPGCVTQSSNIANPEEDQVVTGLGAAHCAGMKGAAACDRVNASNWSKFDHNGQPLRDVNGKITKGPNYQPPVLDGLY
jgi:hypothetical protein